MSLFSTLHARLFADSTGPNATALEARVRERHATAEALRLLETVLHAQGQSPDRSMRQSTAQSLQALDSTLQQLIHTDLRQKGIVLERRQYARRISDLQPHRKTG